MHVESFRAGRVNVGMEIGTQALDKEIKGNFLGDPNMGGLAKLDENNRIEGTQTFFVEPSIDKLQGAKPGGIGNAAHFAIAPVLRATINETQDLSEEEKDALRVYAWAIMTTLGNDDVGRLWTSLIDEDIDKSLIKKHPELPSGLSVIYTQTPEFATDKIPAGERAIYYRPGASGAIEFTSDDVTEIRKRNPFNVNISYPGLFPYGADRSKGANLAWFVRQVQEISPCISFDTHGPTKLEDIEPALPIIDMFNSNFDNAVKVFLNKKVDEYISDEERDSLYVEIEHRIRTNYLSPENSSQGRTKMFTITDRKGTYLIHYDPRNHNITTEYLHSPCASIPPKDNKTGAGDVRFALQRLYVAAFAQYKWQNGEFDWDDAVTAVNIGQIGTALFLQGNEAQYLKGVSLSALEKVAKSGKTYSDIPSLKKDLGI